MNIVCVVLASIGYPGNYKKNKILSNLKKAILIDEKNNKHYVYGSLAEVEAFASKLKITSKKYINLWISMFQLFYPLITKKKISYPL